MSMRISREYRKECPAERGAVPWPPLSGPVPVAYFTSAIPRASVPSREVAAAAHALPPLTRGRAGSGDQSRERSQARRVRVERSSTGLATARRIMAAIARHAVDQVARTHPRTDAHGDRVTASGRMTDDCRSRCLMIHRPGGHRARALEAEPAVPRRRLTRMMTRMSRIVPGLLTRIGPAGSHRVVTGRVLTRIQVVRQGSSAASRPGSLA